VTLKDKIIRWAWAGWSWGYPDIVYWTEDKPKKRVSYKRGQKAMRKQQEERQDNE
jgi:hypothetical protein